MSVCSNIFPAKKYSFLYIPPLSLAFMHQLHSNGVSRVIYAMKNKADRGIKSLAHFSILSQNNEYFVGIQRAAWLRIYKENSNALSLSLFFSAYRSQLKKKSDFDLKLYFDF